MTVHRFLITASDGPRIDVWAATADYSNWLEGRDNRDRETWLVMVMGADAQRFLTAARMAGATVEELIIDSDTERYELRVGAAGTGWAPAADTDAGAV